MEIQEHTSRVGLSAAINQLSLSMTSSHNEEKDPLIKSSELDHSHVV